MPNGTERRAFLPQPGPDWLTIGVLGAGAALLYVGYRKAFPPRKTPPPTVSDFDVQFALVSGSQQVGIPQMSDLNVQFAKAVRDEAGNIIVV